MRHGKKFNHLGRKTAHRKAMLSNMASSLILHKRINTTVAKAKALRLFVEPILTKSKTDSTHSRRVVFSYLQNKHSVSELFKDIAPKIADRPGGYTRILKTGNRLGDNAEMCFIELVDFNETYTTEKKAVKKTRRRGGSGKGAAKAAPAKVEAKVEAVEEAEIVEETIEVEEKTEEATVADEAKEEVKAEAEAKTEAPVADEVKAEAETPEVKETPKAEESKEEGTSDDEEKKSE
ncbi:MAG: 50S ribosomal protein L17 [Flavobacteriales bacterium]|nr:50S ribosomal protein L17 [Flavobacteriales bacterium]